MCTACISAEVSAWLPTKAESPAADREAVELLPLLRLDRKSSVLSAVPLSTVPALDEVNGVVMGVRLRLLPPAREADAHGERATGQRGGRGERSTELLSDLAEDTGDEYSGASWLLVLAAKQMFGAGVAAA